MENEYPGCIVWIDHHRGRSPRNWTTAPWVCVDCPFAIRNCWAMPFWGGDHLSGPVRPTEQRADLSLLCSWNWRVEHGFYMLACVHEIQTVHHTLKPVSMVETSHNHGYNIRLSNNKEPDAVILCSCLHFYSVIINLVHNYQNPPNWVWPKPNSLMVLWPTYQPRNINSFGLTFSSW